MNKYVAFVVVLIAVTTFSFTQAFDGAVLAVGGADCNGSDISGPIDCTQLAGPNQQVCTSTYQEVTSGQAYKDQISESKTECTASGCTNIPNNPSPKGNQACTKQNVAIDIDPVTLEP